MHLIGGLGDHLNEESKQGSLDNLSLYGTPSYQTLSKFPFSFPGSSSRFQVPRINATTASAVRDEAPRPRLALLSLRWLLQSHRWPTEKLSGGGAALLSHLHIPIPTASRGPAQVLQEKSAWLTAWTLHQHRARQERHPQTLWAVIHRHSSTNIREL